MDEFLQTAKENPNTKMELGKHLHFFVPSGVAGKMELLQTVIIDKVLFVY